MKKTIAVICAIIFCLSFCSCTGNTRHNNKDSFWFTKEEFRSEYGNIMLECPNVTAIVHSDDGFDDIKNPVSQPFVNEELSKLYVIYPIEDNHIGIVIYRSNTYLDYPEESTQTMFAIIYLCDPLIEKDYDKALDILNKTFDAALRNKSYKHHGVEYWVRIPRDTIIFSASVG